MAAEAVSAVALFIAISIVRFGSGWRGAWQTVGIDAPLLAMLYAIGWTAILWLSGLYRLRVRWSARTEAIDVARAVLLLAVGTFVFLFWFKLPNVSRQFLVLLFPAQLALTVGSRIVLRWAFGAARARGLNSRFVLIVGDGPLARAFAGHLRRRPELGLHVIGHLTAPPELEPPDAEGPPLQRDVASADSRPRSMAPATAGPPRADAPGPMLGTVNDLERILHTAIVDEVAICLPSSEIGFIEPITRLCEDEGRVVRIRTDEAGLTLSGAKIEDFDGMRILSLVYGPDRAVALLTKRIVDVMAAAAGLVLLSPLLILIAAW